MRRPHLLLLACGCALAASAAAAPFTVEDLVVLKRISDPQVSPDGRFVAFVQRDTDLEANGAHTSVWLLPLKAGAQPQRLLEGTGDESSPRWSPNARTLYFLSRRSGSSQVWRLQLGDSKVQRVTDYPLDVGALKVSPRGDALALSMQVYPDCPTLACSRARLDAAAKSKASGRSYDRLFVRHWDTWSEGTRSHLFTTPLGPEGSALAAVDVSRGFDADIPGKPFGGDEDFSFSPDGRTLVFSARIAGRTEPWSTNFDLFQVPVDASTPAVNLTASNPAWDAQPVFLANGDLAWLAQDQPGYESDRFHICCAARAAARCAHSPQTGIDRSARLGVTHDGERCLRASMRPGPAGAVPHRPEKRRAHARSPRTARCRLTASRANSVVLSRAPTWVRLPTCMRCRCAAGRHSGSPTSNHELLGARSMGEYEQFSFPGWNNEKVYGYVVKPYGFEPAADTRWRSWCTAARRAACRTSGTSAGTPRPSPAPATAW